MQTHKHQFIYTYTERVSGLLAFCLLFWSMLWLFPVEKKLITEEKCFSNTLKKGQGEKVYEKLVRHDGLKR